MGLNSGQDLSKMYTKNSHRSAVNLSKILKSKFLDSAQSAQKNNFDNRFGSKQFSQVIENEK